MVCSRCRRRGDRIRIFVLLPDPQSGTVHRDQRTVLSRSKRNAGACMALVNDAIDYQELQTGERNEGIMYSAYSFFRKLANAVSGSSQFALGIIGYQVSEAVQTTEVVNRIWKNIHRKLCDRIWSGSVGIVPALPAWKEENTGNAGTAESKTCGECGKIMTQIRGIT